MAKRPRSHVIGDEAINAIKKILPSDWVISEPKPDYGLDLMVQIVENEKTTGKRFFIQSKGTDEDIQDNVVKYQIDIEHLKDYQNESTPVLFIIYSTKSEIYWGKWVNNLNIKQRRNNQRNVTITFDSTNIIDADFFKNLPVIFSNQLPAKANIISNPLTEKSQKVDSVIQQWLSYFYNNKIEFNNPTLVNNIILQYNDLDNDIIEISITDIKNNECKLNIDTSDKCFSLTFFDTRNGCPIVLQKVILIMSKLLAKIDFQITLKLMTHNISDVDDSIVNGLELLDLLSNYGNSVDYGLIKELCNAVIDNNKIDFLQMINLWLLLKNKTSDIYYKKLYQENLHHTIEKPIDNNTIGIFCYNLANSYLSEGIYYLASEFYQKARKYEPQYLLRYYWWKEYAGVLYMLGHYKISEKFYKKAIELCPKKNNDTIIFELLGDTLFQQGRYKEAHECYMDYFKYYDDKKPSKVEVMLKINGCLFLIEQGYEGIICNGVELFNSGIKHSNNNEDELAMYEFMVCWCLDEGDLESLINCFICAFSIKNNDAINQLLHIIYNVFGEDGFNHIVEEIKKQPWEQKVKDLWLDAMIKVYDTFKETEIQQKVIA